MPLCFGHMLFRSYGLLFFLSNSSAKTIFYFFPTKMICARQQLINNPHKSYFHNNAFWAAQNSATATSHMARNRNIVEVKRNYLQLRHPIAQFRRAKKYSFFIIATLNPTRLWTADEIHSVSCQLHRLMSYFLLFRLNLFHAVRTIVVFFGPEWTFSNSTISNGFNILYLTPPINYN